MIAPEVLIAICAIAALAVGAVFVLRQRRGLSREEDGRATELQDFLVARVDDLRRVLARNDSAEARRIEAYAILAQMESRNVAGQLDAFIQDNRQAVDAELSAATRPN